MTGMMNTKELLKNCCERETRIKLRMSFMSPEHQPESLRKEEALLLMNDLFRKDLLSQMGDKQEAAK